jgi:Chalcone isomerase-like
MRKQGQSLFFVAMLAVGFGANAAEVAGVKLEDKTQVESRELVLNGAGLRKRVIFNVYVIGLYLPEKKNDAAAVLALPGPKRAAIHMLRDVGANTFTEALVDGLRANTPEAEYKVLEPRVQELAATMGQIGEAKKGMNMALDWTGNATQLVVNGRPAGKPITGEDFYRALLRIWLGDKPVQHDLKKSLLGA